jgi:hypothetical protein
MSPPLSGLNLSPSLGVQAAIRARFSVPVNHFPAMGSKQFFLVVSFGRCKIQLSEISVGHLIQVTVGGKAADFMSFQLSPQVFRFEVASKDVDFTLLV